MALIDSEEAAKRLARVILSDIELYNREKIKSGADIKAELEEGAALFRARVVPALVPLFESVVADKRAGRASPARPAPRPVEPVRVPEPVRAEPVASRSEAVARSPEPARPALIPVARTPEPARRPEATDELPVITREDAATPRPVREEPARPDHDERSQPPRAARESVPTAMNDTDTSPTTATSLKPAAASPRSGPIDSVEGARRLARVIISDIEIYNTKKIAAGADLTSEITEGRTLFKARVVGNFASVFEEVLTDKGLARLDRGGGAAAPARAPAPRGIEPAPRPEPRAAEAPPAALSAPPARAPAPRQRRDLGTPPPVPPSAVGKAPPSAVAERVTPAPSPRATRQTYDRAPTIQDAPAVDMPTPVMARTASTPAPALRNSSPVVPPAPAPLLPPPAELSVASGVDTDGAAIPTAAPTEPTLPVPAALVAELAPGAPGGVTAPEAPAKRDSWAILRDGQGKPSTARVIIAVGAVVSAALLIYYLWTL